jgi:hypothetical protein
MPEINLPTKAVQDAIKVQTDKIPAVQTETNKIQSVKDDTGFIRNQFPIGSGGIKSVQRGDVAIGVNTTLTISAVNVAKSFVVCSHDAATTSTRVALVNSTTIAIKSNATAGNGYLVNWQVIEFN